MFCAHPVRVPYTVLQVSGAGPYHGNGLPVLVPAPNTLTEIDDIYLGLGGIERPARTLPFRGLSWLPLFHRESYHHNMVLSSVFLRKFG